MTRRYYHPELPSRGGFVQLSDAEVQHATRVMRVDVGEGITLFDGRGHEAQAEVISVSRREVSCRCGPASTVDRESSVRLDLGIAMPKPDRAKEMIERLTELGVASVTPIVAERTQRPPSASLIEKLRRSVIEASKQCGRNRLMIVNDLSSLKEFVGSCESDSSRWIAHPAGTIPKPPARGTGPQLIVLIGPEGGWSDEEVTLSVAYGFETVQLGKRILRIETAAALIASITTDSCFSQI